MTSTRRGPRPARAAAGVVLIAMVVLLTGCGKHKGAQMDSPLTEAAAREQINTYLLDTLEALPPGVGLSRTPDNPNLGTLGTGAANTVPCEDDNSNPTDLSKPKPVTGWSGCRAVRTTITSNLSGITGPGAVSTSIRAPIPAGPP